MNLDYEIELRRELRFGPRVHILTTDQGMILAHGYPYHGDRFVRIPEGLEAAILEMCADPTLDVEQTLERGK